MLLFLHIRSACLTIAATALIVASPARAFDPAMGSDPATPDTTQIAPPHPETSDLGAEYLGGIFDEIRLGGSTFLKANVPEDEEGAFVNGQILFDPLWGSFGNYWYDAVFRPRPHLGGTLSVDDGTSQIFGGATWEFPIGRFLFVEASFGGTIHDGPIEGDHGVSLSLGCRVLFRESAGIGVNLGRNWRIIAAVDHSSHASLCSDDNDGLSHVGASVGYRF